jgi:hypothetical protein
MQLTIDRAELRDLLAEVVTETLAALDYPAGRIALTEAEAAAAVGRPQHCLRDARLRGELAGSKAGKAWVYQRSDLLAWLKSTHSGGNAR